jgi:hypothetical protein
VLETAQVDRICELREIERLFHDHALVAWWLSEIGPSDETSVPLVGRPHDRKPTPEALLIERLVHGGIYYVVATAAPGRRAALMREIARIFKDPARFLDLHEAIFAHVEVPDPWGSEPVVSDFPVDVLDCSTRTHWEIASSEANERTHVDSELRDGVLYVVGRGFGGAGGRKVQAILVHFRDAEQLLGWPAAGDLREGEARGELTAWSEAMGRAEARSAENRIAPDGGFALELRRGALRPTINHLLVIGIS